VERATNTQRELQEERVMGDVVERPILFSGPMVRAILEGRKTQTRRVVNLPKDTEWAYEVEVERRGDFEIAMAANYSGKQQVLRFCPYGKPGERLWVRETWAHCFLRRDYTDEYVSVAGYVGSPKPDHVAYKADVDLGDFSGKWRPSIHMPRWASRIALEVTGVRVEQLQEIGEGDAIQEGVEHLSAGLVLNPWRNYLQGKPGEMVQHCSCARRSFQTLWDSINGKRGIGWKENPWVWVVEFRRVEG
jgi:hypothetical protein